MTGKEDGIMYNVHSAKAEEFINHQEIPVSYTHLDVYKRQTQTLFVMQSILQ